MTAHRPLLALAALCLTLTACLEDPQSPGPDPDPIPRPDAADPDAAAPDATAPDAITESDAITEGDAIAPDATDPDAITEFDASPDAAAPDATLDPDAAPIALDCDEAIAHYRRGTHEAIACAGWGGVDCAAPVNPCCDVSLRCEAGQVQRSLTCDDSCAQGCATYAQPDCPLDPACTWFDDGACGPAPEGFIEGPICAPRPQGPCQIDDDCAPGQRCQPFWVAACVGEDCDACGGSAYYCVY